MMKKKKITLIVIVSIFITSILTRRISKYMTKNILNSVYVLVEKENDLALKKAFKSKKLLEIKDTSFLNVIKNKNEEIIEVTYDIEKCEQIMNYVTQKMSESIDNITSDGYTMFVPSLSIFDWPLLTNLGPKIPVKIVLTDVAMGNIRTEIREYGINNALLEIYIDIDVKIAPVLLSQAETKSKKYSFLLSSKLITGKVPDLYNGKINRESVLFNLPVEKNVWYN